MSPRINIRVVNYSGNDSFIMWFKNVPFSITDDEFKSKINEIKNKVGDVWEIERNLDIPHGVCPYNWDNC